MALNSSDAYMPDLRQGFNSRENKPFTIPCFFTFPIERINDLKGYFCRVRLAVVAVQKHERRIDKMFFEPVPAFKDYFLVHTLLLHESICLVIGVVVVETRGDLKRKGVRMSEL